MEVVTTAGLYYKFLQLLSKLYLNVYMPDITNELKD